MKGRKAIPSKIIDIRGGSKHTHRPPRSQEPKPDEKMPTCPKHLDAEARKEWRRTGKILQSVGIMTDLDRSTLAAYCDAYSRWVMATNKCREMGMVYAEGQVKDGAGKIIKAGIPKINPYHRIAREAYDEMLRAGTLIGMSPSSRASLKVEKPTKKPPEQAQKERFFK